MLTATFAYHGTAISQTAVFTEAFVSETVCTVFTAILTDLFRCTFTADIAAALTYIIGALTAAAASVAAFATIVVYALFAIFANICTVGAGRRAAFTYVINASDT